MYGMCLLFACHVHAMCMPCFCMSCVLHAMCMPCFCMSCFCFKKNKLRVAHPHSSLFPSLVFSKLPPHAPPLPPRPCDAGVQELDARIDKLAPGNVCTYIYTSGTTGMPKV